MGASIGRGELIRLATVVLVLASTGACAQAPVERPVYIAPNAPQDAPVMTVGDSTIRLSSLLEPCQKKAMAQYANARQRFQQGLPARHSFFVTTRVQDAQGRVEQVFVVVDEVESGQVVGRLWSEIGTVEGYRHGQQLTVPETEIIDWMISRPDGTEEGNWAGRFMDAYQATGHPPIGICDP